MRTPLPSCTTELRAAALGRTRAQLDALGRALLRWQARRALARLDALDGCRLACVGLDRREIEDGLRQMLTEGRSPGRAAGQE